MCLVCIFQKFDLIPNDPSYKLAVQSPLFIPFLPIQCPFSLSKRWRWNPVASSSVLSLVIKDRLSALWFLLLARRLRPASRRPDSLCQLGVGSRYISPMEVTVVPAKILHNVLQVKHLPKVLSQAKISFEHWMTPFWRICAAHCDARFYWTLCSNWRTCYRPDGVIWRSTSGHCWSFCRDA